MVWKDFHVKESSPVRVKSTPKQFWVQTQGKSSNCVRGSYWNRAVISYWSVFNFQLASAGRTITLQSIRDLVERAASHCASKPTPEPHLERERDLILIPPNLRKHIRSEAEVHRKYSSPRTSVLSVLKHLKWDSPFGRPQRSITDQCPLFIFLSFSFLYSSARGKRETDGRLWIHAARRSRRSDWEQMQQLWDRVVFGKRGFEDPGKAPCWWEDQLERARTFQKGHSGLSSERGNH